MGMDVSGINPSTEVGEYFRANVWSWRPIYALMAIANERHFGLLVDEDTLRLMRYNDGAGLRDQSSCNKMADALQEILVNPERFPEDAREP